MLPYRQTASSPVCALDLLFLLADHEVQVIVIYGISSISLDMNDILFLLPKHVASA